MLNELPQSKLILERSYVVKSKAGAINLLKVDRSIGFFQIE